jgi:alkanesulfonate monooxygenase SsuD/methylene tetrahydromethanopterin reductase-like flavin-dependent oxidoreductase (luciferase family)
VLLNVARGQGEIDVLDVARDAHAAGLSGVMFADSPRLFPDPIVESTRVLSALPEVMTGPCILSLPLQHPARAASELSTLARHYPGRLVAVVGRGESSTANEGLTTPNLKEYAAMLASLERLLDDQARPSLHLMGAASGPRTITTTAHALGGVLVDVGVDDAAVARAVTHARAARPDASVWAFLRVTIATDPSGAARASASLLGSCASRVVAAPHWYGMSGDLATSVAELAAAHDYRKHGRAEALRFSESGPDARLALAAAFVRSRFILADSPEVVTTRLASLASTGLDGVVLAGGLPGVLNHLTELGRAARAL